MYNINITVHPKSVGTCPAGGRLYKYLAVVLGKLEKEHKEMMLCLDITCLCLEQPVWFENACDSSHPITLLDFCHIRAFFRIVTLDPDKV